MTLPDDFYPEIYLELNPDVKNVFKTIDQAKEHYLIFGIKENRIYKYSQIPDGFILDYYLNWIQLKNSNKIFDLPFEGFKATSVSNVKLNIVYYCWINETKNYYSIIAGQLDDIIESNIGSISKLYIVACCENPKLISNIEQLFFNKLNKKVTYELDIETHNYYEYYGINKLYSLSLKEPNSYFLYFHSKGMFNYDNVNDRHIYEKTLTKRTLYNFKNAVDLFDNNPNVMKIGLFPSNLHKANFIWFNFFYVRGIYLITCETPVITENRFYYETWLESGNNNMGVVYNLYENNYKKYLLGEAADILNMLNGK